MKNMVTLFCAFFSCYSDAQTSTRYQGFVFNPDEVGTANDGLPSALVSSFETHLKLTSGQSSKSIVNAQYLGGDKYFLRAIAPPNSPKPIRNRFLNHDFSPNDPNSERYGEILAVVSLGTGKLHRLISSDIAPEDMGAQSALGLGLSYNGREGNLVYGCQLDKPFRYQDLNFDGVSEFVFIGGVGQFYRDQNGVGIDTGVRTTVRIFDISKNYPKQMFYADLSAESFGMEYFFEENEVADPGYQSFTTRCVRKEGCDGKPNVARPGERLYRKLYFGDYDKDNKLDLVVWTKEYKSRKKGSETTGYELLNDEYEMYHLHGDEFVKVPSTIGEVKGIIESQGLTWRAGWPSRNECKGFGYVGGELKKYEESDPVILDLTGDPRHNLNDPDVLP